MNAVEELGDGTRSTYVGALARYIRGEGETALAEAYRLGRRALSEGFSLLDWTASHHGALVALGEEATGAVAIERAATFLAESLSPFEMAQRGYIEAIGRLERLNDRLKESNAELEAFSYSVAHDLRAPVRRAEGFSQIILEDFAAKVPGEVLEYLQRLRGTIGSMGTVIDGLLALARAARAEPRREVTDLAPRARAILTTLRQSDPARVVDVTVPHTLPARCDPALVEIVLDNLIRNAWKFTSKKPAARLEIGLDSQKIPPVYFVRDDGAGFDMADSAKLFGAFQRLHPESQFSGTGIGLATVQRIVSRHGGRIWADAAVDRGTTFYFTLEPESGTERGGARKG